MSGAPAQIQSCTDDIGTMIRIPCPYCGVRDHSEFVYGSDASVEYPALDAPAEAWLEAVFERENIDGVQFETWQHLHGGRMGIVGERDTTTHQIHSVRAAHPGMQRLLNGDAEASQRGHS